ncbi:hypothetical protein M758_5G053100 [Ceratodon purpureus]|nr:hypothetical protein M758_5G053100 [Ceratodon purpureus]KAG0615583.1 hypothetical protein M758_5G053100 [Ceratodon purpureus]KAG0615584.1 hypothetical protein M758_5G053100 [Ceratodon purpureus]
MASVNSRSFESLKEEHVEAGLRKPPESTEGRVVIDGLDVLHFIDFKWDAVSTQELCGHFTVTAKTCQPFGVLHGGITAFLAETLASMGAQVNANWARVAGIDLNVNHLLPVALGDELIVKATPLRVGKRVQVWDVKFTTPVKSPTSSTASSPKEFATTAVARLTLLVGLPAPEKARDGNEKLIAIAKAKNMELPPDERSGIMPSKL